MPKEQSKKQNTSRIVVAVVSQAVFIPIYIFGYCTLGPEPIKVKLENCMYEIRKSFAQLGN